ncbi:MAG: hypothetical protein CVV17_00235 [Gammaproteobacteria bacterium HGW-Gammaproteobacteria-7]|jgi:CHASE3 domain sensor protein|nr:MAG: hypothetical protein CVV17_00235 [Gammaproteobacteria bacterium HGW-Gammaproteobacteria-7]PKN54043.1 MAG: hypothetical protein CVU56_28540 [Deltaproteobacteria bacterium HGW-Deltaproteobacteria-14]
MATEPTSLALRRFESYYARLDEAVDQGDVELVQTLIEERSAAVEQLIATHRGQALPDAVKTHLVACEEALRARLTAMHAEIASALAAQRRRGAAALRYTQGGG